MGCLVQVLSSRLTLEQLASGQVLGLCWDSPASSAVYRSLQYILCLESSLGAYR